MAPMTRSHVLGSRQPERPQRIQNFRESSFQYVPSETQSERELSEEPPSSYEGDVQLGVGNESDDDRPLQLEGPENAEEILHPLREAANRVGREVERFAEVLDGYNPQKTTEQDERYERTIDLIDIYHGIANETVERLRERHAPERREKYGIRWRKTMRGIRVTPDEDEMDIEDSDDENEPPTPEQGTTLRDLERWEQEAQTWDLLRRLVLLRYPSPKAEPTPAPAPLHQYSSGHEIWDNFLATDKLALERETVLRWLKDSAEETGEDINTLVQDLQQNADRGDIIAHGWIHTKSEIKLQKRNQGVLNPSASPAVQGTLLKTSKAEPLVTQLDPDAPTRQNRKLKAQDEYFERAIWLGCYEMLRRGKKPSEVKDWCLERTEVWRAVSMLGFPDEKEEMLVDDDLVEKTLGNNDSEDEDSPNKDTADDGSGTLESCALWRQMCFAMARKGARDDYERAVYGILSGDISTVEPVCRSWDDFLFAHYNALLRTQFDNYLRETKPRPSTTYAANFGTFDAVQFHGDPQTTTQRLIGNLKSDLRTSEETKEPMKMIQGVLIADQFAHFIYHQGLALSKFANKNGLSNLIPLSNSQPEDEATTRYIQLDDHDSLRVLTHILLVLMSLGINLGGIFHETAVENVIVAYISFLRLAGKEELIPLYCSQLTGKRKYAILCRNLIDITDHEQRVTQVKLMTELGLDVQEFVNLQARFLISDHKDTSTEWPATGNFKLFINEASHSRPIKNIRLDFLGDDNAEIDRTDILLIRSLEWYLLVDGLWSETFNFGTLLYLRFFKHMHLTAARKLASRVPSAVIARKKTKAIIGESLDLFALDQDEEDLTEVIAGSAEQSQLLKRHLAAEAKSFKELETLIECLDSLETVTSMVNLFTEQSGGNFNDWEKGWRTKLVQAMMPTNDLVQHLLKGWLLASQKENMAADFKRLREAYLPETLLVWATTLHFAGQALTRDYLMECMEIGAVVAEEGSDLLDIFMKTGRMQDLVKILAETSKSLVIDSSRKPNGTSKKRRIKGWTHDLWSVKS